MTTSKYQLLREIKDLYHKWLGSISVYELTNNDLLALRAKRFEQMMRAFMLQC